MMTALGKRWRMAVLVLLFAPALAWAAPATTASAGTAAGDQAFARLADRYFDEFYLPTNPTAATSYGIHKYDGKLEDYSSAGIEAEVQALKGWEQRVAATDPARLNLYVRGDRDLVLNNIRSSLLTLQAIRPWEKNRISIPAASLPARSR